MKNLKNEKTSKKIQKENAEIKKKNEESMMSNENIVGTPSLLKGGWGWGGGSAF